MANLRDLYDKIKKMVQDKLILFREDENGGFVVVRGKIKNSGVEYYVDKGTIALLKLMENNVDFNEIISFSENNLDLLRNLEMRLRLFILDASELAKYGWKVEAWSPTWAKYPHMLSWEITWRCNLRCIYCYSSAGELPLNYNELSFDEIKIIIDKIRGKILSVWIGGGEPTLRKDLLRILNYLRKKDFFIMLSTNGVNLYGKRNLIKEIADIVDEVHVPLDGSVPEIHNKLRGEFHKIVEVINEFVKLGANISSGTVITKINMHDVGNIIDLVAKLGVKAWVWTPLFPCGRGLKNKHLMLSASDLVKVYRVIKEKEKAYEGKLLIMKYTPGVTPLKMKEPTVRCGAANYYVLLTPNGDVYPCPYFRWPQFKLGNLVRDDLEEILDINKRPILKLFKADKPEELEEAVRSIEVPGINIKVGNKRCAQCPLYRNGYCNTGCKAMKIALGLGLLDPFPYCTIGIEGSPPNEIYKKLTSKR